jgi:acetyl-CoA acetyltransferase
MDNTAASATYRRYATNSIKIRKDIIAQFLAIVPTGGAIKIGDPVEHGGMHVIVTLCDKTDENVKIGWGGSHIVIGGGVAKNYSVTIIAEDKIVVTQKKRTRR